MQPHTAAHFSPLSLAVFVERTVQIPEEQLPELRFDFPRIPSSPTSLSSSSSTAFSRTRRNAGNSELHWA